MSGLIAEFLYVLAYSRRTQWALWIGVVGFVGFLALGFYFASHLSFEGRLAPLTQPFQYLILERYDRAAWAVLVGAISLAVRSYLKDRKRLLS